MIMEPGTGKTHTEKLQVRVGEQPAELHITSAYDPLTPGEGTRHLTLHYDPGEAMALVLPLGGRLELNPNIEFVGFTVQGRPRYRVTLDLATGS